MADTNGRGMAEFSAAELDHLEDALESLELAPAREAEAHLRRRLDDYRNILALSRAAMPMVDVPRGLLDNVLAEARASTESPAITPSVATGERPGFWGGLRRFALLPGVALAGTAALVLLMVERKPEVERASPAADATVARAEQDDAQGNINAKIAAEPAAAAPPGSAPAAGTVDAPIDAASAIEPAPPASAPMTTPTPAPEKSRELDGAEEQNLEDSLGEGGGERKKAAEPIADVKGEKVVDSDTPRWDIIARGDRARHRGDCGAARNEYAFAIDDVDARVRARAHAGLGLCEAARGDRTSADAAYKAARELDGEIIAFIDDERSRGTGGTTPAKAKPKSDVPAPTQNNAFDPME